MNYVVNLKTNNEKEFGIIVDHLFSYDDKMKVTELESPDDETWVLLKSKLTLPQIFNLKFVRNIVEIPESVHVTWKKQFEEVQ
jgi:hypothetical protein